MAEVICSECGKVHDIVVCEKCYQALLHDLERLDKEHDNTLEDLKQAQQEIQILQDRLKECEQCKECEALYKVGGDVNCETEQK